jgi:hypothetical protein
MLIFGHKNQDNHGVYIGGKDPTAVSGILKTIRAVQQRPTDPTVRPQTSQRAHLMLANATVSSD